MNAFLFIYDRPSGTTLRILEYKDMYKLAEYDRQLLEEIFGSGTECVVLRAPSLEDIKRTHGKYFSEPTEKTIRRLLYK